MWSLRLNEQWASFTNNYSPCLMSVCILGKWLNSKQTQKAALTCVLWKWIHYLDNDSWRLDLHVYASLACHYNNPAPLSSLLHLTHWLESCKPLSTHQFGGDLSLLPMFICLNEPIYNSEIWACYFDLCQCQSNWSVYVYIWRNTNGFVIACMKCIRVLLDLVIKT